MAESRSVTSFLRRPQEMGWAALITGLSILLSRFMGLIRDKVISFLFGATGESDLYFAAFVIPDFINYLMAGAYFSITLIPLLTVCFKEDEEDGWHFFSTVFTWITLFITSLTAVGMIFAPEFAHLSAPGLQEESLVRLAFFLRIILPAQICFLLGSCFTAILYLRRQFLAPALAPLLYNLMIILGGLILRERGMEGFCWGVPAGAFLGNLLIPYLLLKKGGGLKLRFSLYHPGLKRFVMLALPLMIGQSIVVLDEQLVRVFGSLVGFGAISHLNYARRIMMVPVGVVAQAASVASYPFLADLAARDESSGFYQTLNRALRSVPVLLVPLSVWMMIVAEPTIRLIFQQGHFSPADSQPTARLLQIFLAVVFCWGIQQVLGRGFYAYQDTITPAVIGTVTTVISLPLYYLLATRYQAEGVAAASAISIASYTLLLAMRWRYRFGKETFSGLGRDLLVLIMLSITAGVPSAIIAYLNPVDATEHVYLASLYAITVSGFIFVSVFGVLAVFFKILLIEPIIGKIRSLWPR
ncbi:MAG: murein biosynthesis integral membrane protein MurJ [Syntrophobacteraceae bacterium]